MDEPKPRKKAVNKRQKKIIAKGRQMLQSPDLNKQVIVDPFLPAARSEKALYAKITKTQIVTRTISELGRLTHEGRELAARSFSKCVQILENIALGKASDGEIAARLIKGIREHVQLQLTKYGESTPDLDRLNKLADDAEEGIGSDAKDSDKIAAINALGKYGLGERHDVNISDQQTLEIFTELTIKYISSLGPQVIGHWQAELIDAMKNAKPGVDPR